MIRFEEGGKEIVIVNGSERKRMDILVANYWGQIYKGQIEPNLVFDIHPQDKTSSNHILTVRNLETEIYEGVVEYTMRKSGDVMSYSKCEGPVNIKTLEYWENKTIRHFIGNIRGFAIEIDMMEAFIEKNGIGRLMIETLKNQKNVNAIYSDAFSDTQGFFLKSGFNHSGLYTLRESGKDDFTTEYPVMLWKR